MQYWRTFRHIFRIRTNVYALICGLLLWVSGLCLQVQRPFDYRINVGSDEYSPVWGPDFRTDVPFLDGFLAVESHQGVNYRWMSYKGQLQVLGVGQRPLILRIQHLEIPPNISAIAPLTYTMRTAQGFQATLPVPLTARQYQYLWPHPPHEGSLRIQFRSEAVPDPAEPRVLATPVDSIRVQSTHSMRFVLPDWRLGVWWGIGIVGLWWVVAVYRHTLGWSNRAWWVYIGCISVIAGCLWVDFPRTQLAAYPFAMVMWLAVVMQGGLLWIHRTIITRHDSHPDARYWADWSSLIALSAISVRFFGRIYPGSMPGDIQFHANRLYELSTGWVYIVSNNRGVDFPYPPLTYLFVMPFIHGPITAQVALPFIAALVDGFSVLVIYLIMRQLTTPRWATVAGALYVGVAATFMTTWWSFDSHIYTQGASLVLWYQLIRSSTQWNGFQDFWKHSLRVLLCLVVVFLGHYGFLINTTLLMMLSALIIIGAAIRQHAWARRIVLPFITVVGIAGIASIVIYYSQYLSLFMAQITTASTGGLQSVTGRAAIQAPTVLQQIGFSGFYVHFGLFPVLVAPLGLLMISRERWRRQPLLLILIAGSLTVAGVFAVFPLLTGVSNSPRWLMFIAWVIIAGCTAFAERLWRRGTTARISLLLMAGFVLCNTLWVWIAPMLWRWRPPEPF